MQKKQRIHSKPAYFRGQLLLEDDFIAEQQYHAEARRRHAAGLHGWGIVTGLDVEVRGACQLVVRPGLAIDRHGEEVALRSEELLDLTSSPANVGLYLTLSYEEEPVTSGAEKSTRECFALLTVAADIQPGQLILARIEMDEGGQIKKVDASENCRSVLRRLCTGWLRVPFRPTSLPEDEAGSQPGFRVGPTEARAHRLIDGQNNEKGAAGTMAIPLAPGVVQVRQLRVAGAVNDEGMTVSLYIGGWRKGATAHGGRLVLTQELGKGDEKNGKHYDWTGTVTDGYLDDDATLSVEICTKGYVRISLVAVELVFNAAAPLAMPGIG